MSAILPLQLLALVTLLGSPSAEEATICPTAKTTQEMVHCFAALLVSAEKQLDALGKDIMEQVPPADRSSFERADRAWRDYQEANCESVAVLYDRGSIRPVMKIHCKLDMTRARMTELRNIQENHLSDH